MDNSYMVRYGDYIYSISSKTGNDFVVLKLEQADNENGFKVVDARIVEGYHVLDVKNKIAFEPFESFRELPKMTQQLVDGMEDRMSGKNSNKDN